MKGTTTLAIGFVALALSAGIGLEVATGKRGVQERALVPLPANPSTAPVRLVAAQPFVLDEPYTHWWRAEQPSVRAGYILVLSADPDLIRPRQTLESVLFVGDETAERCNAGTDSGHLIVLVPSALDAAGNPLLDPENTPIWFGDPELPERIESAEIERQRARAEASGVLPPSARGTLSVRQRLATLFARDRSELDLIVADHIERYSPTELDLIESLRMPLTR